MSELPKQYHAETQRIINNIPRDDRDLAQCADYRMTSFLGTSNACVCSLMGKTEAARTMRDGLHEEFMREGKDDLWAHLRYIGKTWNMNGGGVPLVSLILENGMKCPGFINDSLKKTGNALESGSFQR
jgi:hypothetical protein